MSEVVKLERSLEAAREWQNKSRMKPTPEEAVEMFMTFKASFPSLPHSDEQVKALARDYVEVFMLYPIRALDKAMRDFRLGLVERNGRDDFLPSPREFGAHVRNWSGWVIDPPPEYDVSKIYQAIAEERVKQIEGNL